MSHLYIFLTLFLFSCEGDKLLPDEPIIKDAGLQCKELWNPPQNTVYIDPENSIDSQREGSFSHPYCTFSEVKWKDHTVYALKRGSHIETGTIMIFANNVTLASYGKGDRPKIISSSQDYAVSTAWDGGNNILIRDIEIYAPKANSCIIFRSNSTDVKVFNCKLHAATWGIRALNNIKRLQVRNTEIFNIWEDGMFIRETDSIEISYCYIHDVNKNWKPPYTPEEEAGGDGIQFYLCNNWHVHHNIIDRRDSGNKFCFISNNPEQDNGIFEYNVLKGPLNPGFSIYIGDGKNIIIRYNYISGPSQSPLWSHASNLKIYYNIFNKISGPLFVSGSAEVYNNLFYKTEMGIEGGEIIARNNIFDLGAVNKTRFKVKTLTENNNFFVYGLPTYYSEVGYPKFINPSSNNFRLSKESACINKGVDVGILFDIEGNKVPYDKDPDIGPYEYHPQN